MSISTDFRATKIDDVSFTMEITMSLRDWRCLLKRLGVEHPDWRLAKDIQEMIYQVDRKFYPTIDRDGALTDDY